MNAPQSRGALMSSADYRESLRRYRPMVFVDGRRVDSVADELERGVAHDPARAIARNRQPGKCCDTGCTAPGQGVMVDLPVSPRSAS